MSEQLIQDILKETQPSKALEIIQKRAPEITQETVSNLNTLSSQELSNGNVNGGYALANYALMAAKLLGDEVTLTRAMATLLQAEAFAVKDLNDDVINHHQAAMNRADAQQLPDVKAMVALSLGNYYRRFDHLSSAIRWYKNAIEDYNAIKALEGVSLGCQSLLATGQYAATQGKMDLAQRALETVRDITGQLPIDKSYLVTSLVMLGDVYFHLAAQSEDEEKRRLLLSARTQSYERVLANSEIEKDRSDAHQAIAGALRDEARVAGSPTAIVELNSNAEKHLKTAALLAEESSSQDSFWRAKGFLGDLYAEQGKLQAAYREYTACLNTIEDLRSMARTAEERMLYFDPIKQHFYFAMIDTCLALGQARPDILKKGFYWLEASREREILDQLGTPKVNWMEGAPKQLLDKLGTVEEAAHGAIQPVASVMPGTDETKGVYILTEPQRYIDFLVTLAQAKAINPAVTPVLSRKPATVAQLQKRMADDSVFVEYLIVQREVSPNPELLIFAVSKSDFRIERREIKSPTAPAGGTQTEPGVPVNWLAMEIADVRKALRDRGQPKVPADFGKSLYDLLLAPVEDLLKGAKNLCIVPFGILRYLPFEALRHDGRYVIEDYSVNYSLSGSITAHYPNKSKHITPEKGKFLGISYFPSDEPLLAVFQEQVKEAKKAFAPDRVQLLQGRDATDTEAIKAMPQADFIHIGTQSQIVEGAPLFDSVFFAPAAGVGGSLPAYQIQDLALKAEMVTLAGCQVGMGYYYSGDELAALIASWNIAGVPSVAFSLWLSTTDATVEITKRFYENLKTMPKAEALRQAKLSVLAEPATQHPYHWSPFVLYGVGE